MGEVILGMPGPWANDKCEASDHYTTKIGGLPDWPIPSTSIRSDLLLCSICGSNLCLVAQVYAPVSSKTLKIEERIIYVFGCVMPKCGSSSGSWRAIRMQKLFRVEKLSSNSPEVACPTTAPLSVSTIDCRDDLWTFDSREDDDGEDDHFNLEELGWAFAEAASLAGCPKKKNNKCHLQDIIEPSLVRKTRVTNDTAPVLPCFYMYTLQEAFPKDVKSTCLSGTSLPSKGNQIVHDDQAQDEIWEQEGYEYDRALNADRMYLKFKKRMDAYPEQCLRYCYGGKPLLAAEGVVDPGICSLCGGSRQYEMQLMPPLLYFLQEEVLDGQECSLENWNWMTLALYTCSTCCSHSNQENTDGWTVAEEFVMVQYE